MILPFFTTLKSPNLIDQPARLDNVMPTLQDLLPDDLPMQLFILVSI